MKMEITNTNSTSGYSGDIVAEHQDSAAAPGGLRLALMSKAGIMKSIWVQGGIDGKYRFESDGENEDYSFMSIEVTGKKFFVKCYRRAKIVTEMGRVDSIEISSDCLIAIEYKDKRYKLYVEAAQNEGNIFHNYYVRKNVSVTIGRTEDNDIVYSNDWVSRSHALLRNTDNGWIIEDTNSANGVYVNGQCTRGAQIFTGDRIFIMGLNIIVGVDFISINDKNDKIKISNKLIYVKSPEDLAKLGSIPPVIGPDEEAEFNRLPRRRKALGANPITVEAPPVPMGKNGMPMFLRIGSSAVMGGRSIMTGNYSMALTSLVFPFLSQRYSEKEKKEYEERRTELYSKYLSDRKQIIESEKKKEEIILNDNYPELLKVLSFVNDGKRLWERRTIDDDFMSIRIGSGTLPMVAEIQYPEESFNLEEDKLETAMYELVKQEHVIKNVPIMADFVEEYVAGVVGDRMYTFDFIKAFVMQAAVLHSPDELKMVFLMEREDLDRIEFIKYLPHVWDDYKETRFIATNLSETFKISEYLQKLVEADLKKSEEGKVEAKNVLRKRPYYMVIASSRKLFDGVEVLKDIMGANQYMGVGVMAAFDDLPKECLKVYTMHNSGVHSIHNLKQIELPDQEFVLDRMDYQLQNSSMRQLANIKFTIGTLGFNLPKALTFLEMFGAGRIEHLNILKRWKDNNPVKTLATPIGVGTDGSLFMLDLHEKFHGPHGLVAGMTGSGKSEFIITYILSLALNYHPDEVAFILIDYKGGGLTGAFDDEQRGIHLPHLVGTITNLDGAAITRSLASIQSELKRRQAIFNKAKSDNNEGTMDIYEYQKLHRAGKVAEPLPHLFIISDEFAELKAQQPEFMDQLISTARIGRSLGVHLILATQKPAGVVNDQIWSNSKFRICLRVQDKYDSMDMLKRPEAAELKDTGRFYLQVGYNEYFALGQSGWCGADYEPQDEVISAKDDALVFVDSFGQKIMKVAPESKKNKAEVKQVVAIVNALTELAKKENIAPRQMWTPPLKTEITLDELYRDYDIPFTGSIEALVGLMDDPDGQIQIPFVLDVQNAHNMLVVGEGGSGKTTFIQTMLYSLVDRYSPEDLNFYILDFSSRNLRVFSHLPHCGAVLDDEHESDINRLLEMIDGMLDERKKLFAKAEVNSFEAYRQVAKLPLVLFIVDNMLGFSSFKRGGEIQISKITEWMRECSGYGIKVILTGNHMNAFSSKIRQETDTKVALKAKDQYAYQEIIDLKCKGVAVTDTKGRGLCNYNGRPLEYHTAMVSIDGNEQERMAVLKAKLAEIETKYDTSFEAKKLATITEGEAYEEFYKGTEPGRIPLGYSIETIKRIELPLHQLYCLSLYFGNDTGFAPVLKNYMYALAQENMKLIIVKKRVGSIFDDIHSSVLSEQQLSEATMMETSEEDCTKLSDMLVEEIQIRKVFRNEYFEEHGIVNGKDNPVAMSAASKYIRTKTTPLMVVFESFADFCQTADENANKYMSAIFAGGKGYNMYYIACFRPGEAKAVEENAIMQKFNSENMGVLYGGCFKESGFPYLPQQYSNITSPATKYNNAVLSYREAYYPITMPCGQLIETVKDMDEEPII